MTTNDGDDHRLRRINAETGEEEVIENTPQNRINCAMENMQVVVATMNCIYSHLEMMQEGREELGVGEPEHEDALAHIVEHLPEVSDGMKLLGSILMPMLPQERQDALLRARLEMVIGQPIKDIKIHGGMALIQTDDENVADAASEFLKGEGNGQ